MTHSLTGASLEQLQLLRETRLTDHDHAGDDGLVIGLDRRLLEVDRVVALLGAAPGGISGMSLVGAEFGVGAAVASFTPFV